MAFPVDLCESREPIIKMGGTLPKKAHPPPITDPAQLQRYSDEHLKYELDMFFSAARNRGAEARDPDSQAIQTAGRPRVLVSSGRAPWFEQMAAIEAFVLHFRNLVAFLFPDEYPAKSDDVAAHHFVSSSDPLANWISIRGPLSESIRQAKTRADKELAHLTTRRIAGYAQEKSWDAGALANEVESILCAFLRAADPALLGPKVKDRLQSGCP